MKPIIVDKEYFSMSRAASPSVRPVGPQETMPCVAAVGTYCIPVGGLDGQSPHTEDEIYVVTAGRAQIETPGRTAEVGPGAVIFVPAGEEHRFTDVTEDLVLLVMFGPAYGSRSPSRGRENA